MSITIQFMVIHQDPRIAGQVFTAKNEEILGKISSVVELLDDVKSSQWLYFMLEEFNYDHQQTCYITDQELLNIKEKLERSIASPSEAVQILGLESADFEVDLSDIQEIKTIFDVLIERSKNVDIYYTTY